jgi:acyl carrier protein
MSATPDSREIARRIKEIISNVAGLDPARIEDRAALREDLSLDSLSLLEIAVDVDITFNLKLPDESYQGIASLPQMVELVDGRLRERAARAEVVGG